MYKMVYEIWISCGRFGVFNVGADQRCNSICQWFAVLRHSFPCTVDCLTTIVATSSMTVTIMNSPCLSLSLSTIQRNSLPRTAREVPVPVVSKNSRRNDVAR